ncbi:MAG: SDR family NAD(P)-dependent oxidoreductase [Bdellovibrionia bacterium]
MNKTHSSFKKAVLVTGASSGIGKEIALRFSKAGYFVYLMGRNKEHLAETALNCTAGASILSCDLNDVAAVDKRLEEIFHHPQYRLEVLINNAGIYKKGCTQNSPMEDWLSIFSTNLFAAVQLTQKVIPYFQKHEKGSIVNISSTLGLRPTAETAAYSASKAAMINWTASLALEVAPYTRVNCICPGIVDTPIHSFHNLSEEARDKVLLDLGPLQPLNRIGSPTEIAEAAYFLGSDLSSWTTGAILSVDGGINLK